MIGRVKEKAKEKLSVAKLRLKQLKDNNSEKGREILKGYAKEKINKAKADKRFAAIYLIEFAFILLILFSIAIFLDEGAKTTSSTVIPPISGRLSDYMEAKIPSPVSGKPKLKKALTLFDATVYGVGIILGAGIYALIGQAAGIAGNALWLSFVLAAVIAAFTALSYAELSSIFPKEAAEYVYSERAFKSKLLAFFIGWVAITTGLFAVPTVVLGFAGYFAFLFGTPLLPVALGLIVVLSLLNFWGIKESARFNLLFTLIEVGGLIIIILIALPFLGSVDYFEVPAQTGGFFGFLSPVLLAASLIFFAYLGFEEMANIAEETRDAKKTIPRALLLALVISTIIYLLVAVSVVSVVPYQDLAATDAPLALVASTAFGGMGGLLLAVIALFATTNTVLIMLIVSSRMLYGMANEGSLPHFLKGVHHWRKTPHMAILVTFLISVLFTLMVYELETPNFSAIETSALLTNVGLFVMFLSVNISVIALRFRVPDSERKFKIPFNIGKVPIPAVLGALICFGFLFQFLGTVDFFGVRLPLLVFALAIFALSVPAYYLLNRH